MKKILAPTNFSPYTHTALRYAADFAKKEKAEITLFHATVKEEDKGEAEARIKEEISTLQQEDQAAGDFSFNHVIEAGPTLEGLNKALAAGKYDLITIATRNEDNINQNIGSITSKVTQKGKAATLVVPENNSYQALDKVLIINDFTSPKTDIKAIQELAKVAQDLSAKVHLLHITLNDYKVKGESNPASLFKDVSLDGQDQLNITHYQDLVSSLKELISAQNIKLIYLPSEQGIFTKIFVGNLARKLALETQIPVYVHF